MIILDEHREQPTMIYAEAGTNRLCLAGESHVGEQYQGMHAFLPVAVGASLPLVIALTVMPTVFRAAMPFALMAMAAMMIAAVGIAIFSMLHKGEVVAVALDPSAHALEFTYGGLFANTAVRIPASHVAAVEMSVTFDDDGYRYQYPQIVTSRGEQIPLPVDVTASDLAAFRKALQRAAR